MEHDLMEQARIADEIEAAAYSDMYAAVPSELARTLQLRAINVAGATLLMANDITDPMFSRVIGLGNSGAITDAHLDEVTAAYRSAGIASYWIHVNPVVAPRDLAAKLEQRGLQVAKRRTWAKMIRGTEPAAAINTTLSIRLVTSDERARISECIAAAFGMPRLFEQWLQDLAATPKWTMVGAFDGTSIVGGGLLFMQNRVGWLGMGAVVPEARGQHAHRAVMTKRIDIAIERGCTHIVTETGEPINNEPNPSLRNMYRCGFTRVCSRVNYAMK